MRIPLGKRIRIPTYQPYFYPYRKYLRTTLPPNEALTNIPTETLLVKNCSLLHVAQMYLLVLAQVMAMLEPLSTVAAAILRPDAALEFEMADQGILVGVTTATALAAER